MVYCFCNNDVLHSPHRACRGASVSLRILPIYNYYYTEKKRRKTRKITKRKKKKKGKERKGIKRIKERREREEGKYHKHVDSIFD